MFQFFDDVKEKSAHNSDFEYIVFGKTMEMILSIETYVIAFV